jgi:hypothetical protein
LSDFTQVVAASPLLHILSMNHPTAIHLALSSKPDTMIVSFTTGNAGTPVVSYGTSITMNDNESTTTTIHWQTAKGTSDTYQASDMCRAPANETAPGRFQSPGVLHTVAMKHLKANVKYSYKVGLETTNQKTLWSDTYQFVASPFLKTASAKEQEPFSFLVYGDQGCPSLGWSTGRTWVSSMVARELDEAVHPARVVHHFGDLAYAEGAAHVWDEWHDMIQPLMTRVPLMIGVGNHEYDYTSTIDSFKDPSGVRTGHGFMPVWGNFRDDSGGECGVATAKRFAMPASLGSNGVFWYSYDFGNVHTIMISSEHDLSARDSLQYQWLEQDLARVDRAVTPWVIVETHRPLYNAEASWENNKVGIAMRREIEDLLVEYDVDLVLAGHYHAYFRTCDGLYKSQCGDRGPTHITVGSAGAHLDDVALYPNQWTAYHVQGVYGYGRITVMNSSSLHYEYVVAGADTDETAGQVLDDVWISRSR